jgi:hypothetical protein
MIIKYYSIKGKGKYAVNESEIPDSKGMVNALDFLNKKSTKVKKSQLTQWKSPSRIIQLVNLKK